MVTANNGSDSDGPVTTKKIAVNSIFIRFTMKGDLMPRWQEDRAMKQNTTGKFFIMKKTCLCIAGLLLLGMLCVPVAATTQRPGYWNFDIINDIMPPGADILLDNKEDNADAFHQRVYVSDDADRVELHLKVTAGPDTTLTITKDYITTLRNKCERGWDPAVVAHGGVWTYDVDADCLSTYTMGIVTMPGDWYVAKVHEHLEERGGKYGHISIGDSPAYVHTSIVERHVCRKNHLCS